MNAVPDNYLVNPVQTTFSKLKHAKCKRITKIYCIPEFVGIFLGLSLSGHFIYFFRRHYFRPNS
jgi:hypothetical protein